MSEVPSVCLYTKVVDSFYYTGCCCSNTVANPRLSIRL